MATRCGSLWFVLGVVSSHVVEEDHQQKQSHAHHVGEYRQLYVCYHPPPAQEKIAGHNILRCPTASPAVKPPPVQL